MVSPTNPIPSDLPDPFESQKEEVESEIPAEIVSENLPIPEPEKELEDFDISIIETPTNIETATTEIATEALQIETPEKEEPLQEVEEAEATEVTELENLGDDETEGSEIPSESPLVDAESPEPIEDPEALEVTEIEELDDEENELEADEIEEEHADLSFLEELDLTSAEVEEAEELEEDDAEMEDIEDEEEEDLNLITNAISDDYVDPNGQEFKKLLEEILPLDDTMHILPKEQLESAAHFFDLEHKVFYTHKPFHQKDLTPFRNTFLQLDLTEDEIRSIKITRVPLSQWESFVHKLKSQN